MKIHGGLGEAQHDDFRMGCRWYEMIGAGIDTAAFIGMWVVGVCLQVPVS